MFILNANTTALREVMIFLNKNFTSGSLVSYTMVSDTAIKVTDTSGEVAIFKYVDGNVVLKNVTNGTT